ncbi:hypothetical protein P7C73_g4050, partial [Tremellales sp. Uapishka_1]
MNLAASSHPAQQVFVRHGEELVWEGVDERKLVTDVLQNSATLFKGRDAVTVLEHQESPCPETRLLRSNKEGRSAHVSLDWTVARLPPGSPAFRSGRRPPSRLSLSAEDREKSSFLGHLLYAFSSKRNAMFLSRAAPHRLLAMARAMPLRQRLGFFFLSLLATFSFILYTLFSTTIPVQDLLNPKQHVVSASTDPLPFISIIAVFKGTNWPTTIGYLFQGIKRQVGVIELILIQRGPECSDLTIEIDGGANIKHICIDDQTCKSARGPLSLARADANPATVWDLHVDYLCDSWKGCTGGQRKQMQSDLVEWNKLRVRSLAVRPTLEADKRGVQAPQSYFPILRGWIFKQHINPKAYFWGWCDLDTIMGDFQRTFPYDLASDNYDLLMPSEPSDGGGLLPDKSDETGGDRLIFMRGHLIFVRNRSSTERKLLDYYLLSSYENWQESEIPGRVVEEAEYSHFVVAHPSLNILQFDAMARNETVKAFSRRGALTLPATYQPQTNFRPVLTPVQALGLSSRLPPLNRSTFSPDGIEHSVTVHQGAWPAGQGLWFEDDFVSYYHAPKVPDQGKWRRFLMKKHGRWTERLEPWPTGELGEEEWLYHHWQEDKRKSYFKKLAGKTSDIFVNDQEDGNAGFDAAGKLVYWVPREEERCDNFGCVPPGEKPLHESNWVQAMIDREDEIRDAYSASKGREPVHHRVKET